MERNTGPRENSAPNQAQPPKAALRSCVMFDREQNIWTWCLTSLSVGQKTQKHLLNIQLVFSSKRWVSHKMLTKYYLHFKRGGCQSNSDTFMPLFPACRGISGEPAEHSHHWAIVWNTGMQTLRCSLNHWTHTSAQCWSQEKTLLQQYNYASYRRLMENTNN